MTTTTVKMNIAIHPLHLQLLIFAKKYARSGMIFMSTIIYTSLLVDMYYSGTFMTLAVCLKHNNNMLTNMHFFYLYILNLFYQIPLMGGACGCVHTVFPHPVYGARLGLPVLCLLVRLQTTRVRSWHSNRSHPSLRP